MLCIYLLRKARCLGSPWASMTADDAAAARAKISEKLRAAWARRRGE